ncbi:transposase, partial [Escherichia coli]|nr:transposase [Escherichia coli]
LPSETMIWQPEFTDKTLSRKPGAVQSRHSDTAKAFAYLLKQWEALNVYCSNGWVEIDNNIAENALRGVAVGRKNWLFAGSDSGGEHAAVLYSLTGTCRLNNVEPEKWLRYVIEHIQDWPANRVRDLLPWKVDLTSQ